MNLANIFKSLKQVTLNTMDIKFLKAKTDILTTKLNEDVHSTLATISGEIHDARLDIANIKDVTDKIEFVGDKISTECLPAYVESVKDIFMDEETGEFYNVETSIDPITQEVTYELGSTLIEKVPGVIYHDVNEDKLYRVSDLHNNIEITTSTLYYTKQEVDSITQEVNSTKLDKLTSGTNIKTLNGLSILGEGNVEVSEVYIIDSDASYMIECFDVNKNSDLDPLNYNSPQEFTDYLEENALNWQTFGNICQDILLNINKTILVERQKRIGPTYFINKSEVINKYTINRLGNNVILTFLDVQGLKTITYTLRNVYGNIWISFVEEKNDEAFIVEFTMDSSSMIENIHGIDYDCSVNVTTAQIYQAWNQGRTIYAYDTESFTILRLTMPPLEDIAVFSGIWVESPGTNMELRIWEDGEANIKYYPMLKQLYFDSEPTENSDNILTSGNTFTALLKKLDKILFGTLTKNIFTEGKFVKTDKNTIYQTTSGEITPQEGTLYVDIKYGKIYTWFGGGVGFMQISGIKV